MTRNIKKYSLIEKSRGAIMKDGIKKIFLIQLILMAFLLPLSGEVQGEKEKGDHEIYTLGEVLVQDSEVRPGVVSKLGKKELEKSPKGDLINTVSEAVPSFHTGNNRVMGFGVAGSGAAAMSIRGIGVSAWSPQTGSGPSTGLPILINGMDVSMMINNHAIADIFSLKNVEHIEVLHGPQPVLYGSSAMGGIVNVVTKRRKEDGFDTRLSASYGSHNSTDDHVEHYGKIGAFDYGLSYNFRYTDGARTQTIGGTKFDSKFLSNSGTLHMGYRINSHWYLGLDSYTTAFEVHDPGASDATTDTLENFKIIRGGGTLQAGNRYGKLEGVVQLYGNWGHHKSYQPAYDNRQKYDSLDQMLGFKAKEALKLDFGMTITGGSEYRWYGGTSKDKVTDTVYTDGKYIHEGSLFTLIDQRLVKNKILLSGGGRYTYNSEYGSYGSWQGGAIAKLFEDTKIHFHSAQGFKVPDIIQYYNKWTAGDTTILESGTELKPETYLSLEAGIEQEVFEVLSLSSTLYRIYSENRFTKVVTGPGTTEWTNGEDFNYWGVEAGVTVKAHKLIEVSSAYSFIDNDQKGRKLPLVPRHKVVGTITFRGYGFLISMGCEYVKEIYLNDESKTFAFGTVPLEKLDDYFLLNAKVAYTFLENYTLFCNFNNITNTTYAAYGVYEFPPSNSFKTYPMVGFHWRFGTTVKF